MTPLAWSVSDATMEQRIIWKIVRNLLMFVLS